MLVPVMALGAVLAGLLIGHAIRKLAERDE